MIPKPPSVPSSLPAESRSQIHAQSKASEGDYLHMVQVARLALQLFDELRELHREDPPARAILETSALLHDIGFSVSEQAHHKHSRDAILQMPLPGFSPVEQQMIACIARYHRGAVPDKKHRLFGELPREMRQTVRHLSAILRVADGLDRSHQCAVRQIRCALAESRVQVCLMASGAMAENLLGVQKKKAWFETLFNRTLEFAVE